MRDMNENIILISFSRSLHYQHEINRKMQENAFVSEETRQREALFTKMEMFSRVDNLDHKCCVVESESYGWNGFREKGLIMSCKEPSPVITDVLLSLETSRGMSCSWNRNSRVLMVNELHTDVSISQLTYPIKLKLD